MRWISRHWLALSLGLVALICATLVFGLVRYGYLSWAILASRKDAFAALQSLLTTLGFLVAFLFSYYRFFAGRTFARLADLTIAAGCADSPGGGRLHGITVCVKNVGTLTIREPELNLYVTDHLADGKISEQAVAKFTFAGWQSPPRAQQLIDPGETDQFHAVREVPAGTYASTYFAIVEDDVGNSWRAYALVTATRRGSPGSETGTTAAGTGGSG